MEKKVHAIYLTEDQADVLEEAMETMVMSQLYVDSYEEVVERLARSYVEEYGSLFEVVVPRDPFPSGSPPVVCATPGEA